MRTALAICLWLFAPSLAQTQGQPSLSGSSDEVITIDGKKNPELIPQWVIWRTGFTMIRQANDIPSDVIGATTKEERALMLKDAAADASFYKDCDARANKLREPYLADMARMDDAKLAALVRTVQPQFDVIEMECRRHTLDLRDHVLAGLNPQAQTALSIWVDSIKSGYKAFLRKSDLAAFRLPE